MKKNAFLMLGFFVFAQFLISCATLQTDIFYSSDENEKESQAASFFESEYIVIDRNLSLGKNVPEPKIMELVGYLEDQRNVAYLESSIRARLCAIEGCLFIHIGKYNNAQELYKIAKSLQNSDDYVILLGVKLVRLEENRLEKIDSLLMRDENNSLLQLEKAKILNQERNYAQSVSAIDKALLLFSQEGRDEYVKVYSELKEQIWKNYKAGGNKALGSEKLVPKKAVELMMDHSELLNFYTSGRKMNVNAVFSALEKQNFFSTADDENNENQSSVEFVEAKFLDRRLCARFLWNIYTTNKSVGRKKYSPTFAQHPNLKSPIADVAPNDRDFDAIMGCVENEIINLTDGRNFEPEIIVNEGEFVEFLLHLSK